MIVKRPTWPETWMNIAKIIAERSYDKRLQVGSVIVTSDNSKMLSVGYNGNYKGGPHEPESLEPGQSQYIHAEVNALIKCDYHVTQHKHMYVTHSPCKMCAKLIINAGIKKVVYDIPYRDDSGVNLLLECGIDVYSIGEAIIIAEEV